MQTSTRRLKAASDAKPARRFASTLKQGRRRRIPWWERVLWLLVLVIIVFALGDLSRKHESITELRRQLNEVDVAMEYNRLEHQRLEMERVFRSSDAYTERYAREELGWLRPGDLFFIRP